MITAEPETRRSIGMNLMMDTARDLLGRAISDHYGATIGKIVGISTDAKNRVTSIEIELGNGQFANCLPAQIVADQKGIRLLEDWKLEADSLIIEFDLAVRRIRALSDLHRQGDVQPEIYEDFRRNHDLNMSELEKRKDSVIKRLNAASTKLEQQIRELETFLTNNKMQLAAGEIDPQAYKIATDSIENGLRRALSARRDIDKISGDLAGLRDVGSEDQTKRIPEKEGALTQALSSFERILPAKFSNIADS